MTNHFKERIERKEKLGELNRILGSVITHSLKMMGNGELEKYERFHKECLTKRKWCNEHGIVFLKRLCNEHEAPIPDRNVMEEFDYYLALLSAYTHYAGSE